MISLMSRSSVLSCQEKTRNVEEEIDYFKILLSKSIRMETNGTVKKDLRRVRSTLNLFERAKKLELLPENVLVSFSDEIMSKINDVHDDHVGEDCYSCQALGFVSSDVLTDA